MFSTKRTMNTSSGQVEVYATLLDSGDARLELTMGDPLTRTSLEIPQDLIFEVGSAVKSLVDSAKNRAMYEGRPLPPLDLDDDDDGDDEEDECF